jgi:hypothetical protein
LYGGEMMDYSKYEEQLNKEVSETWVAWILILVLIGVLVYMNKSDFYSDTKKWIKWACNVFIVLVIVGAATNFIMFAYNTNSDIENQSYIVYEGVFSFDYYRGNYVYIYEDGKRRTLTYEDAHCFPAGTYNGKLVYAKKRGRVLEIIEYVYIDNEKIK